MVEYLLFPLLLLLALGCWVAALWLPGALERHETIRSKLAVWTGAVVPNEVIWRAGYAYASKAIKHAKESRIDGFLQTTERDALLYVLWGMRPHLSGNLAWYWRGERARWEEEGLSDAHQGLCRAGLYKDHSYNTGWHNAVLELHKHGWRNAPVDEVFEIMEVHYWKKISSGKSQGFYDQEIIKRTAG